MQDGQERCSLPVKTQIMNPGDRKVKVAILASTLNVGGAERVIEALALGLPDRGFDVDIFCLRSPGIIGSQLNKTVFVKSEILRGKVDPIAIFKLSSMLKGYNILFTIDHHNACFYGSLASWLAGVRVRILAVHSTGLWQRGSVFSRTDKIVLSLFNSIVALADKHRQYLIEHEGILPEKIAIIPNGVDIKRFSPLSNEDRLKVRERLNIRVESIVVSIVAALRPEKNHTLFLRAASKVLGNFKDFIFLIIGDGPQRGNLERFSVELGLEGKVRFLGIRDDVEELLGITDIAVLCSYPVVETFPLSILEAMSCGVPVVATDVGSIGEFIENGKNGILIESNDLDALSNSILKLAKDSELREKLGQEGRKTVIEKFSINLMVNRYAELFRKLVGNGGN